MNTDTPLPPDEPVGENPPDGAMIDYQLPNNVSGPVTFEIKDGKGNLVRRFASTDDAAAAGSEGRSSADLLAAPAASRCQPQPGNHRFLWDLHYAPLPDVDPEYPMPPSSQTLRPIRPARGRFRAITRSS